MLEIRNLHVSVDGHEILRGVDLVVQRGTVHSIMGPNGSGKSTLAQVIAGHEAFEVTDGDILYNGKSIMELGPDERACEGIFLAFQYPVEIPGVSTSYFLRAALNAIRKYRGQDELDAMDFLKISKEKARMVDIDERFLTRAVNEGFSGGEKKRNEIFQMAVLEPQLAVLDETAMFYLRSRGLDEAAARSLLIYAFASEALDEIKIPELRRRVNAEVVSRLPQGWLFQEAP